MAKVHVLVYDDGNEQSIVGIFRKKPTDKKLAELELAQGLDTVEDVREAYEIGNLVWEKSNLY